MLPAWLHCCCVPTAFPFLHVESKWGLVNECLHVIARQMTQWEHSDCILTSDSNQHSQKLGRSKRSATCYQSTSTLIFGYQLDLALDAVLRWRYGPFPSHLSAGWLALWPASLSAPHLPDLETWTVVLVSHQKTVPTLSIITNLCLIMLLLT